MIGIIEYSNLSELIMHELCDRDIHFKLKHDTRWRKGKMVAFCPLAVDECLVGIEIEDLHHSNITSVEYYTFSEINVMKYDLVED